MNEWTHIFIKIYLSHFILERVDVGCVSEVSWRRGQTTTYCPEVLLTIAALLSHPDWDAQPWVTKGPKPSVFRWLSIWHLVPNYLQIQLTQAVCLLVIFLFSVHLLPLFFRLFTQMHLLIDGRSMVATCVSVYQCAYIWVNVSVCVCVCVCVCVTFNLAKIVYCLKPWQITVATLTLIFPYSRTGIW